MNRLTTVDSNDQGTVDVDTITTVGLENQGNVEEAESSWLFV